MARTTAAEVIEVMAAGQDYDLEGLPSLDPYIRIAGMIVTQLVACAANKGVTYSDEDLATFETWLAAHSYAMSDQPYASKSTGGQSASFQGQTGKYLEATKYGQMASSADGTGCLMAITSGKSARMVWLGKTATEALDWDARN